MKLLFLTIVAVVGLIASEPWSKNPQKWTDNDARRILTASPWAQETKAVFGNDDREAPPPGPLPGAAEAGMAGPHGATDGRWDGGVGRMPRGSVPSLPVLIRWDSALAVREASAHLTSGTTGPVPEATSVTSEQAAKDYVITLFGLVPARRYREQGQLSGSSNSGDTVDARDPEELLEGLMAASRLLQRGKPNLAPENVRLEAATGIIHVFFSRKDPITAADKEVTFTTRFGSLTIRRVFQLRDMIYKGRLEL
ncbi:MAG TPA: hypothetical protein VFA65_07390 [Bryobacteraceae bacterium]|nr:hypothetical protein [Bryobacteraceae bacterium]